MRFALLGDHPHGRALAVAIGNDPQHTLAVYVGPDVEEYTGVPRLVDVEEALADPTVDAVIVASLPSERLGHVRRALQSERPVLCVHPVDGKPDGGYELAMLQSDMHQVLMPVMPLLLGKASQAFQKSIPKLGAVRFAELEVYGVAAVEVLNPASLQLSFPGWEILRRIGGDLAEVVGYAEREHPELRDIVFAVGRFERGGIWHIRLFPADPYFQMIIHVEGVDGTNDWSFVEANGSSVVRLTDDQDNSYPGNDWPNDLLTRFTDAVARQSTLERAPPGSPAKASDGRIGWPDAVRSLELDDALRRAIEKRRAVLMEYQEASEEVGFKGTMTLLGCGLMWLMLLILGAATFAPALRWLMAPVLLIFLGLQLLRWLVPTQKPPTKV